MYLLDQWSLVDLVCRAALSALPGYGAVPRCKFTSLHAPSLYLYKFSNVNLNSHQVLNFSWHPLRFILPQIYFSMC
jgi:hypothetical protein